MITTFAAVGGGGGATALRFDRGPCFDRGQNSLPPAAMGTYSSFQPNSDLTAVKLTCGSEQKLVDLQPECILLLHARLLRVHAIRVRTRLRTLACGEAGYR